jgi:hypothetical protein
MDRSVLTIQVRPFWLICGPALPRFAGELSFAEAGFCNEIRRPVSTSAGKLCLGLHEQNARVAALMQGDVQATMPDVHVIVARPIVLDLGVISRKLFRTVEDARFNLNEVRERIERFNKLTPARTEKYFQRQLGRAIQPIALAFKHVTLPTLNQVVDVIEQAALLDWSAILSNIKNTDETPYISFENLLAIDNTETDRKHGVCPIPLYEFSQEDWGLLLDENRLEDLQLRLKKLDIYQYFFPAADNLALGLVEKGIANQSDLIQLVKSTTEVGHPLGDTEIVPPLTPVTEMVETLSELGYLVEGENGVEITPTGTTYRANIIFRPRESLVSKIINRFTVNASLNVSASTKDLFPPSV